MSMDELNPTACTGHLAGLPIPEEPCPRCGGRHIWLTKDCVPVLFCLDQFGNGWHFDTYRMVDPPAGLHVMELNAERRERPYRYAVVRDEAQHVA